MNGAPLTMECEMHFDRKGRGARRAAEAGPRPASPIGRVPRIAKLMALAIRFDRLLRERVVANQAELAKIGHVTRARISQIMTLLNLAPDLQEAILFLPRTERGRDSIILAQVLPIANTVSWTAQRLMWRQWSHGKC